MNAQFPTLDALLAELNEMGGYSSEYWDKQVHKVPKSITVDRTAYLAEKCKEKTVLHIGCTGSLDIALRKVAKKCYGIDRDPMTREDYKPCNLDQLVETGLPQFDGVELVVCGEVLEHLSNPGYFLKALAFQYRVPVIFTVPNAFTVSGQEWLVRRGRENVNKDHVCYYSYTTIKELLRRAGYGIASFCWYNGKPYLAEGLIVEVNTL
jgi:hypothetical protein